MSRGKLGSSGRYRRSSKCSPGGSHVPCPARPRCQQHRRSRRLLQLAVEGDGFLDVSNIDEAVAFYSKLFGTEPAKRRPGYANFAIDEPPLKLVLLENPGHGR